LQYYRHHTDMTISDRRAATARAAEYGAEIALEHFRSTLTVDTKQGILDSVTEIDRTVQTELTEQLEAAFPEEPIIGEENNAPSVVPAEGPAWIIDPIDGTNNYIAGNRVWGVAVAATVDGEPIAATTALPALGETYTAGAEWTHRSGDSVTVSTLSNPAAFTLTPIFGLADIHRTELVAATETIISTFGDMRRAGSAHATLAGVASGELQGAVSTVELHPWDTVGGVHLVRQAGGTVTDLDGNHWRHDSTGLVATNGTAHEAVLDAFQE